MLDAMEGLVKRYSARPEYRNDSAGSHSHRYSSPLHSTSDFALCRYSQSTVCCLYFHLNRVFLIIVYKGNNLVWLLDAIDGHAHLAVPGTDL